MNEYHKISEGILGEETIEKTNTELFLSLVGQYFPEAIKDGEVDFTALKEEMGEFHEVSSEHYDFTWAGKQSAKKEAQSDIFGKTLKYKPQDSLNPDTTENIYIEGDNLEALKLLRRNYHGKIKMIYIDPPYNRGSDLIYCDTFTLSEEELAELSGDIENGVRLQKNPKDNAKYHTKWLNMMYPRLKIARDLLADDGVIFISIDDNEQENLKKICDEIFGACNFVAQLATVMNLKGNNDQFGFAGTHEYTLVYIKNILSVEELNGIALTDEDIANYIYEDEIGKYKIGATLMRTGEAGFRSKRPKGYYPIYVSADYKTMDTIKHSETDIEVFPITREGVEMSWRRSPENLHQSRNEFVINHNANGISFYKKQRLEEDMKRGKKPKTLFYKAEYSSGNGTLVIKDIFNGRLFDNPKPLALIKDFIKIGTSDDSIILDFFSGSATTAHAVMQLNAEDGGNRKFIMMQFPEETDEKSEAYKAGYKNICEIGKERIRRAAKKIHEDNPSAEFDDGFKVFEVADTNIRWNTISDEEIKLLTDDDYPTYDKENIDFTPGHNDIDIVYEIMLRQFDIPLSTPIEKLPEVSDRTYIFANAVVVCLEPEIDEKLIEKLASIEPVPGKFVLRDSAFNDDIELKDVSYRRLSALIANHQLEGERKNRRNNYTVEFI